ncbi:Major Facilitator Superfamily protein [Planctomycetes bacterium MalM25]|nr:Major Facilitator Superfamily protein [Planctomycetes bacterium MalM25]
MWALGNGLVSMTLVVYLAIGLGAGGVAIAWLLAAPRFAGVLRVASPAVLALASRFGLGRQGVCLTAFGLSALVLTLVPAALWGVTDEVTSDEQARRIALLAIAWCGYHLLEYVATVALWSWIGDLYPRRLRSRLIGRRERWLTIGRAVGIGVSIGLAVVWRLWLPADGGWQPLAASATVGAVLMLLACVPLVLMTPLASRPSARPEAPWRTLERALLEKPYRRLLAYSSWLGFANGLSASAQAMYPGKELGIGYETLQAYRFGMWTGQSAIAPWAGRAVARVGAKRVMLPAQFVVAAGALCFYLASPDQTWWIAVAYFCWVFWAPINVGLDTLKLNLADPQNNAPYLAVFHAASDFTNAFTVLAGGLLYDTLAAGDSRALRVYAGLFLAGWIARMLAAPLILRLVEPDGAERATIEA